MSAADAPPVNQNPKSKFSFLDLYIFHIGKLYLAWLAAKIFSIFHIPQMYRNMIERKDWKVDLLAFAIAIPALLLIQALVILAKRTINILKNALFKSSPIDKQEVPASATAPSTTLTPASATFTPGFHSANDNPGTARVEGEDTTLRLRHSKKASVSSP